MSTWSLTVPDTYCTEKGKAAPRCIYFTRLMGAFNTALFSTTTHEVIVYSFKNLNLTLMVAICMIQLFTKKKKTFCMDFRIQPWTTFPSRAVNNISRVRSLGYTGIRGIFCGRTEHTLVSGTGIEFVYRTLPGCSVGCWGHNEPYRRHL